MKDLILQGDALAVLKTLPDESVDCVITSPPYYGLRDYGVEYQLGSEESMNLYIGKMLEITAQLKRVLKKVGTLWWNHGDSYAGSGKGFGDKEADPKYKSILRGGGGARSRTLRPERSDIPDKSLMLQAHRLAIRMVDEQGWVLRNQIIWHKPNVMPSSVKDRFTVDFEPVFFFSKGGRYHFETQREPVADVSLKRAEYSYKSAKANLPGKNSRSTFQGVDVETMGTRFVNPAGRNKRTTWRVPTSGSKHAHVAMFPEKLIEPMIKAGCPRGGIILDPFMGAGTTAIVAKKLGRHYLGIELNPEYIKIAEKRINGVTLSML